MTVTQIGSREEHMKHTVANAPVCSGITKETEVAKGFYIFTL